MIVKFSKLFFALVTLVVISTSCLDNQVESYEAEANKKLQDYISRNGFTEEHNIGNGIYVKVIGDADPNAPMPVVGNTVLMSYTGKYTSGEVFETTDSSDTGNIPYPEAYIYGHKRHKVGALIYGIDTAVRTLHEGSSAEVVIPHQYAFADYEPVVYTIDLHQVIESDSAYEADLFGAFRTLNVFTDTIAWGLFYKLENGDTLREETTVQLNDTVLIQITGRYAENYYDDNSGRLFYPRSFEYDTIRYLWGTTSIYPISSAIDSAVKYLYKGQTMELAFESGAEAPADYSWGEGTNGLVDSYFNFFIIPPYTPLHYTIELLDAQRE